MKNPKSLEEFSNALERYKGKDFKYGLSDKKSERTTFNLGEEAIDSLGWLASHAGVKVKEVIDQANEHWMGMLSGKKDESWNDQAFFQKLTTIREGLKTRKTYVISLGAVRLLNNLSSNFKIPRDMIMETIIIDYALFVKKSNEKRIQKYQLIYDKTIELLEIVDSVSDEAETLLGGDDPISDNFFYAQYYISEARQNIEKALKDGKPLKPVQRLKLTLVPLNKEVS